MLAGRPPTPPADLAECGPYIGSRRRPPALQGGLLPIGCLHCSASARERAKEAYSADLPFWCKLQHIRMPVPPPARAYCDPCLMLMLPRMPPKRVGLQVNFRTA